jgi:hypothetical protein
VFLESAFARPIDPLFQTYGVGDDAVSRLEARDALSYVDDVSGYVGAQDERQLNPRDDQVGRFLDDPVYRLMATARFFMTISFSTGGVYIDGCSFSGAALTIRKATLLEGVMIMLKEKEEQERVWITADEERGRVKSIYYLFVVFPELTVGKVRVRIVGK